MTCKGAQLMFWVGRKYVKFGVIWPLNDVCFLLYFSDGRQLVSVEEEMLILFHALQDANIPKFLAEDVALFHNILGDLFPGIAQLQPQLAILQVYYSAFRSSECSLVTERPSRPVGK